jgi:hypothetical protein
VGKPEGKKSPERPRCRLEDNIKMNIGEIVWGIWTGLIWFRIGISGGLL